MGNCLVLEQENTLKIRRVDEKILNYHSSLEFHPSCSESTDSTVSNYLPQARSFIPKVQMQKGHLNCLRRPKKMQPKETGAVRIKLVISKQELKEILENEGLTLEDMMSKIQEEPLHSVKREKERSMVWKPALESISEENDL